MLCDYYELFQYFWFVEPDLFVHHGWKSLGMQWLITSQASDARRTNEVVALLFAFEKIPKAAVGGGLICQTLTLLFPRIFDFC